VALDDKGLEEFKNEFKNVYYLHHPNLLKADYYDTIGNNPYLVMQYCPESAGDLAGDMSEAEIWKFIKDVASGLAYLHSNDIVHRDIKPDNILKDSMGNYVITDFGLSVKMHSTLRQASARYNNTTDQSGTLGYMAPEMFTSTPNAVKATDIWALGATIYELITGELPFCGRGGVMELNGAELPSLPEKYSQKLKNLLAKCLAKETWDRPTAQYLISESTDSSKENQFQDSTNKEEVTKSISKRLIKVAVFMTLATIALASLSYKLNDSLIEVKDSNRKLTYDNKIQSNQIEKLRNSIDCLMADSKLIACNILASSDGKNFDNDIHRYNTNSIHLKMTFISNTDITKENIIVELETPDGTILKVNITGISFKEFKPYEYKLSPLKGYSNGRWDKGDYTIRVSCNNQLIGTNKFRID
jgi:serine/threonine protein kinase